MDGTLVTQDMVLTDRAIAAGCRLRQAKVLFANTSGALKPSISPFARPRREASMVIDQRSGNGKILLLRSWIGTAGLIVLATDHDHAHRGPRSLGPTTR